MRANILFLATLVCCSAFAQSTIDVPIRVGIVGGDFSVKPIPQLEIVATADGKQVVKGETDLDGRLVLKLAPGTYRIESAKPVTLWGAEYSWNVALDVAPGMRPLELTQKNSGKASKAPGTFRPGDEAGIFENAKAGVVAVYGNLTRGTGFVADAKGLIVTNHHVIEPDQEIRVRIDENTKLRATLVAAEPKKDLAVLAIAMSRCPNCKVLALAAAEPEVGQRVVAIGTPLHHTPAHREGAVTRVQPPVIFSDLNLDHGFSGGPLLTLDGKVAGVNSYLNPYRASGRGTAVALNLEELKAILETARARQFTPPSDALLPNLPKEPYPAASLKQLTERETFDLTPYSMERGAFDIVAMTPPVIAWRESVAVRRAAKTGMNVADSIQLWDSWNDYVKDFRSAVIINVSPKVGKKGSAKFWNALSTAVIAIGSFGTVWDHDNMPDDMEFKADFRDMKLLRDGVEVVPAEFGRVSAVADPNIYEASGRQLSYQGVYVFRPEDFAPHADGTPATFTLDIEDARRPGQRVRIPLDAKMVAAIQKDFAVTR